MNMCGIVGFNWDDRILGAKMVHSLEHRGPDGKGLYTDSLLTLGHSRLAIIDLSAKGKQPMRNVEGDLIIAYNGEIYNFKELREELEPKYGFKSDTDTEVILAAYKAWGVDCLHKLNGMFALCIYDVSKKKLFLARDRLGIKPLYYYQEKDKFIFSSEIKAIVKNEEIKREVDKTGLQQFFTYKYTIGDKTLFKGIKKLLPGHYMLFDLKKKKLQTKKYWDVKDFSDSKDNARVLTDKFRALMRDSVKLRLVSDVPVGFFLSGGIDSSIVTALAKQYYKKDKRGLKTFSVGFETTNELPYARIVSDHLETDHQEILVTEKDLTLLKKMVYHMDEPIGDSAFLPTYIISKFAKKRVTVVQAGEGADELLGGYDRYKLLHYGQHLRKYIPRLPINHVVYRKLMSLKGKTEAEQIKSLNQAFSEEDRKALGVKESAGKILSKSSILKSAQYDDMKKLLPNNFFMKADKMSAAHALEERVPFLDHRIAEFSFTIPDRLKIHRWNPKYVLKKAFGHLLPKEIVKRPKHGYETPMDAWFKGVLKDKLHNMLKERTHNLYSRPYAYKLLYDFQKSKGSYRHQYYPSQKLWSLLVFEQWHRIFID